MKNKQKEDLAKIESQGSNSKGEDMATVRRGSKDGKKGVWLALE